MEQAQKDEGTFVTEITFWSWIWSFTSKLDQNSQMRCSIINGPRIWKFWMDFDRKSFHAPPVLD